MGSHGLLLLIRLKFLIIMTSLQNIDILGAARCADVDEIKIFDKDEVQIFNLVKSRKPWLLISISHLFQQGLFSSWPLLFYTSGAHVLVWIYTV